MKVLIFGSGVIGQIYGGRLAEAGHEVTLLARGTGGARALADDGIRLDRAGQASQARPQVVTTIPVDAAFDVALITVRRDQIADALPAVAAVPAGRVAFLLNQGADLRHLRERVGAARTVFAFPAPSGGAGPTGPSITWRSPSRRPRSNSGTASRARSSTCCGRPASRSRCVPTWRTVETHTVFVTAVGAAILAAGGDSAKLAADRSGVSTMVKAVGEGFRALARHGVHVTPTALRVIFTMVPRVIAVSYWRGQLRGPLGTLALAPHLRATRDTEFPVMITDLRELTSGHGPTPNLDRLLHAASVAQG